MKWLDSGGSLEGGPPELFIVVRRRILGFQVLKP